MHLFLRKKISLFDKGSPKPVQNVGTTWYSMHSADPFVSAIIE